MTYEIGGFLLLASLALLCTVAFGNSGRSSFPARLLVLAVAVRILGSVLRYEVLDRFYNGMGDASGYFGNGVVLAERIWSGGLSPFSLYYWAEMVTSFGDRIWGTPFMIRLSGVVVAVIGPTMRGEFLLFALMAFLGTFCVADALRRVQPGEQTIRFAAWMWFWPSVWFWPSSVGKEATVVFALGLVTLGYVGDGLRIHPLPYVMGLGLAFLVRPHVAAVAVLATVFAIWLGKAKTWSWRLVAEGVAMAALAWFALSGMQTQFGMEQLDVEGVAEMLRTRVEMTSQGGSTLERAPLGLISLPMAIINVWIRPFPWDVHNAQAALAALEALVLWGLIWSRRRETRLALRHWRSHRLLRFAAPLLAMYTLMIGLGFANLGLIARQRAPLMPFLLMFVLAVPTRSSARTPVHPRERRTACPQATSPTSTAPVAT